MVTHVQRRIGPSSWDLSAVAYHVSSLADECTALGEQVQLEFAVQVFFPLNSPFYWNYQCIGKNGLRASPQP
jgi:hypothetical protein